MNGIRLHKKHIKNKMSKTSKSSVEKHIQAGKSLKKILSDTQIINLYRNNNHIVEDYLNRDSIAIKICKLLVKTTNDELIRTIQYIFHSDNRAFLRIFASNEECFNIFFAVFTPQPNPNDKSHRAKTYRNTRLNLYKIGVILELILHSYAIFPSPTNITFHSNFDYVTALLENVYLSSVIYYMTSLTSNIKNCEAIVWYFFTSVMKDFGTGGIIPESIYLDSIANLKPISVGSAQRRSIYYILKKFFVAYPSEKGIVDAVCNSLPILFQIAENDEELSNVVDLAVSLPFNKFILPAIVEILMYGDRYEPLLHHCVEYLVLNYQNDVKVGSLALIVYRLLKYKAGNLVLRSFLDYSKLVFPKLIKENKSISKQFFNIVLQYINCYQKEMTISTRAFCSNFVNILKEKDSDLDSEDFRFQVMQIRSINGKLKIDKDYVKNLIKESDEIDKQESNRLEFSAIILWGDETIPMQKLYRNFPHSKVAKKRRKHTLPNDNEIKDRTGKLMKTSSHCHFKVKHEQVQINVSSSTATMNTFEELNKQKQSDDGNQHKLSDDFKSKHGDDLLRHKSRVRKDNISDQNDNKFVNSHESNNHSTEINSDNEQSCNEGKQVQSLNCPIPRARKTNPFENTGDLDLLKARARRGGKPRQISYEIKRHSMSIKPPPMDIEADEIRKKTRKGSRH
ncbi:hypothetical protein TRFO_29415 [Tritrichomonas foetus]|uniref:Uncharacterized protein n=1 Tax=Tritrichomonas foetus TaxID=1144522 RepID=A0A1J4JVS6_9EUKA|nr:hypothetical protein TRFO_29415 [Tritrichomonas foetus]|eukprot:OHT03231.1 hypothetical protein TRFO_29415 [Tritrichomonas foetus]